MWLGSIYPWAGNYRTVNISKAGFKFAHAPLIPRLMAELGKGVLRLHTPCRAAGVTLTRSLAEVHGTAGRSVLAGFQSTGGEAEACVRAGYPRGDEPRLRAARDALCARDWAATRFFQ